MQTPHTSTGSMPIRDPECNRSCRGIMQLVYCSSGSAKYSTNGSLILNTKILFGENLEREIDLVFCLRSWGAAPKMSANIDELYGKLYGMTTK
ncbi:Hypothetical predicted protein [Pelobates cultripes]|uniref:Uncharacterized protein n=1 Tax=Pelobates cultripes TaxID=61616 RepID=A0AAD1W290_PELCU|nr:Hypothetical predicted protein [Pelobates cultripes]